MTQFVTLSCVDLLNPVLTSVFMHLDDAISDVWVLKVRGAVLDVLVVQIPLAVVGVIFSRYQWVLNVVSGLRHRLQLCLAVAIPACICALITVSCVHYKSEKEEKWV